MDEDVHVSQAQWYCINIFDQYDETLTTPPGLYLISVGVLGPLSKFMDGFLCQVWHLRMTNVAFAAGNLYLLNAITRKLHPWDGMITTPPGLYLVSVGLLVPLSKALGIYFCQPWNLRLTNLVFSTGNIILLALITKKLHPTIGARKLALSALNISFFPVLYFFNFLYYTEVGSVFFVLLAYYHHLNSKEGMAAIFGGISVLFRQTNIVWVFFMACEKVSQMLSSEILVEKRTSEPISKCSFNYLLYALQTIFTMCRHQKKTFLHITKKILEICRYYACVGLAFVAFLLWNGGVALGDKSNHQVTPNFSQFLYFLGFVLIAAGPHLVSCDRLVRCFRYCLSRPGQALAWVALILFVLLCLHYDHHYLTDMRHLGVQLWRKILTNEPVRYLLVPVYYYSAWSLLDLFQSKDAFWKLFFGTCVALSVVLEELFEMRYFILPYVFFRIHVPVSSGSQLLNELLLFAVVNCAMIYWFVAPPFIPEYSKALRFLW